MHHGLKARYGESNIILFDGVDDIWINTNTNKLIVVDYKSQSSTKEITPEKYHDVFKQSYKIQMDFYVYLLKEMGFEVHPEGYFVVCNGNRLDNFNGEMKFDEYLIPYEWDISWVEKLSVDD